MKFFKSEGPALLFMMLVLSGCSDDKKGTPEPPPPEVVGTWIDDNDLTNYKSANRNFDPCDGFAVATDDQGKEGIDLLINTIEPSGRHLALETIYKGTPAVFVHEGQVNSKGQLTPLPSTLDEFSDMPGLSINVQLEMQGEKLQTASIVTLNGQVMQDDTSLNTRISEQEVKTIIADAEKCMATR